MALTLDMDKATMVDLMRYLLSYVGYYASSENHNQGVTELSVWSLLREITKLSFSTPEFDASGMVQNQFRDRHEQAPRSLQQNITMKRGDWICPRCNFLNFARNIKCLECEEARPKRQLTGGEWECPQCDFYNYGRNTVCLRCDCKRPGGIVLNEFNSGYSNNPELGRRLAENEEKAGRWFSKVSQLESASDASSAIADDDFPEIMPLRKGVNRFVVSTRKTPLERRLADAGNRVETGGYGTGSENKTLETKTSRNLDEILGSSSSATSGSDDKNVSSRQFGSSRASNSDFVPFVPLPADMFAKKPEKLDTEKTQMDLLDNDQSGRKVDSVLDTNQNFGQVESSKLSGEQIDQFETQGEKEKEQEEKSARWFKRVTELHGVSDLDKIPDEDFPDIMPMRKGENRFVVSRKKDRSLTSPAYKRKMAMEQAKDSNFVPFVPFPPGYFAKQKQPETVNHVPEASGKNPAPTAGNNDENFSQVELSKPSSLNPAPSATRKGDSSNNVVGTTEDTKPRSSWNGKSLEGSLVKEPDPLDMSEEAKTERWFRRVADIKNISELSQIPDEDFPSIMPMRKGVNRFVVSKRKTPLERRLASQQHRRNFPATDSDSPVTRDS
ncbi:PREDICTED: zinc finger protein VAR3, chloroplastic isoform X2 [Tarenaya hassleriana]|uniref:zinc finger protein VAR3, chloroplastic isoform X2 n=1 Tax=Tarenaya hassleriana TaxID=28532 RepID=UPI00053C904A|nr:PREDICTED: zinc finger protein VAR3, chloroplastic isoform X2 [Tarenaya hassleriana]